MRSTLPTGQHALPVTEMHPCTDILAAVAPNVTVPINLPVGQRYKAIHVYVGASTAFAAANLIGARVLANGKIFWTVKNGTDLDAMNQFYGRAAFSQNNTLSFYFGRSRMNDPIAEYFTWINTGQATVGNPQAPDAPITTMRLELDIGGATAPAITVWAELADNNIEQSIWLPRLDTWTEAAPASTQDFTHTNTPRILKSGLDRRMLTSLWMVDTLAHITSFRIRRNGQDIIENVPTLILDQRLRDQQVRAPQAGYFCYDFGGNGEYANLLSLWDAESIEVKHTTAAGSANPVTVYAETIGKL